MKRISFALLFLGIGTLFLTVLSAQPQKEQGAEFFAGYALNRMDYGGFISDTGWYGSGSAVNFNGFNLAFDKYIVHTSVTDTIGIAVDVGAYFGKPKVNVYDDNLRIYTATVGPQFTNRAHEYLQPFVRALFGVSYIDGDLGAGVKDDLGFAFTAGGGLDVKVSSGMAIRIAQLDYIGMRHKSVLINNFRFGVGLSFLF